MPDLGADLVRVFSIDKATSLLTASTPFGVPAGSGPRHGAFFVAKSGTTYFFLVSELANTVASYKVTYGTKSLKFQQVFISGIYGGKKTPEGAAAAEAILSVRLLSHLSERSMMTDQDFPARPQIPAHLVPQRQSFRSRQLRSQQQHQNPI